MGVEFEIIIKAIVLGVLAAMLVKLLEEGE